MDTKIRVLNTTERDDQGSKVSDFFERTEDMFNEMKWQKKLRGASIRENSSEKSSFQQCFSFTGQSMLFWMSSYMSLWSNILFNCAVLINLIVAFFYPFGDSVPSKYFQLTVMGGVSSDYLSTCNTLSVLLQNSVIICPL